MSGERVELASDTTFELANPLDIEKVHLEDLAFVLDIEADGDDVTKCTLDLEELIHVMTLYSSVEQHRHQWRR